MQISYLSGLWWLIGLVVSYILSVIFVEYFRNYLFRQRVRRDRELRQRYYLTETKERESR